MNKQTLLSLFEQSEGELKSHLSGLILPRDSETLNNILTNLFVDHIKVNEYKETLTDSEMALFQSAIQLVEDSLQVQHNMITFAGKRSPSSHQEIVVRNSPSSKKTLINKSQIAILGVTATGVLAGALPNVGTILLAIVATATGLWVSKDGCKKNEVHETLVPQELVVNVNAIIDTTKKICQSVDNLMGVYQTNIDNFKARIDSRPEPTLYNAYGYLLNRLADLYRDSTNNATTDEIKNDIAKLFKTLKNYNYEFVNYSEDSKRYFDIEEVEEIEFPMEDEVAILENGNCIVKGKYYQPLKAINA